MSAYKQQCVEDGIPMDYERENWSRHEAFMQDCPKCCKAENIYHAGVMRNRVCNHHLLDWMKVAASLYLPGSALDRYVKSNENIAFKAWELRNELLEAREVLRKVVGVLDQATLDTPELVEAYRILDAPMPNTFDHELITMNRIEDKQMIENGEIRQ